jgi:endonuclease-3
MKINKQETKNALIKFGKKLGKLNSKKEKYFTPNFRADKLIWNNSLAYLLAVILDQSMKAEKVWEIPYLLKQRLGHLDVYKIASMGDKEITEIFNEKPKLHRFPNTAALRTKKACQLLIEKYDGRAENVWNDNPRSDDLHRRFEEFDGIGQKKASMATNILARDFGIELKDKRGIDISYDVHIRRVFLRTGLVEKDSMDLMIKTARALNPDYPGVLDNPCWIIGREYCHPRKPKCNKCPISFACPKLLDIKLPETV